MDLYSIILVITLGGVPGETGEVTYVAPLTEPVFTTYEACDVALDRLLEEMTMQQWMKVNEFMHLVRRDADAESSALDVACTSFTVVN